MFYVKNILHGRIWLRAGQAWLDFRQGKAFLFAIKPKNESVLTMQHRVECVQGNQEREIADFPMSSRESERAVQHFPVYTRESVGKSPR
jgi:hypothetical protein